MKALRPLDPTWWRKAPGGYDQQDGRARLVRLRVRDKTVGWALYVDDEHRGEWPRLEQAKRGAASFRVPADAASVPGYSNFGGGGPFAPMGSPRPPAADSEGRRRFMRRGLAAFRRAPAKPDVHGASRRRGELRLEGGRAEQSGDDR